MPTVLISWCQSCNIFYIPERTAIGGHGGKVIIKGQIITPCPKCGKPASSPGGEFFLDHDKLIRVNDELDKTQVEQLKSQLIKLKTEGYPIATLKIIVEGYAPQLIDYVNNLEKLNAPMRRMWVLLLFFILLQIVHNTELKINLDINRLIDQAINLVNNENAPPIPGVKKPKAGRNDPCPCGSGKKYKNCCGGHATSP